jgi:hypothetical protein
MNGPTRTAWCKPELIVIVRGRPEEAVLGFCKDNGRNGGTTVEFYGCQMGQPACPSQCRNSEAS